MASTLIFLLGNVEDQEKWDDGRIVCEHSVRAVEVTGKGRCWLTVPRILHSAPWWCREVRKTSLRAVTAGQ